MIALAIAPRCPARARPILCAGDRFLTLSVSSASPVAMSTISLANWFGSRGRFGMSSLSGHALSNATRPEFKLRHYLLATHR